MSVRSSQSVTFDFTVKNPYTGALSNADGTPTGTLVISGTDNAATVTVTNKTTGVYKAAVTMPTLAFGDVAEVRIAATVSGVSGGDVLWRDSCDLALNSSGHVILQDSSLVTAKLGTFVLAKSTNITGFNDIAATAIVSSGAITTSGGSVSSVTTVTTTTNLTNLPSIPANWITAAGINSGAFTSAKFASGAFTSSVFASGAITATTLANDTITLAKFATGVLPADFNLLPIINDVDDGVYVTARLYTPQGVLLDTAATQATLAADRAETIDDAVTTISTNVSSLQTDVGEIPSAVRTELATELGLINTNLDAKVSEAGGGGTVDVQEIIDGVIAGLPDDATLVGPVLESGTLSIVAGDAYTSGHAPVFTVTGYDGANIDASSNVKLRFISKKLYEQQGDASVAALQTSVTVAQSGTTLTLTCPLLSTETDDLGVANASGGASNYVFRIVDTANSRTLLQGQAVVKRLLVTS